MTLFVTMWTNFISYFFDTVNLQVLISVIKDKSGGAKIEAVSRGLVDSGGRKLSYAVE